MASALNSLEAIRSKLDEVQRFLSVSLSIANAHTVEFYTRNVWDQFMAVPPAEVLSAITSDSVHKMAPEDHLSGRDEIKTTFGFCDDSKRLVDVAELLEAAKAHSLPGLGLCLSRNELLLSLRDLDQGSPQEEGSAMEPEEFMTSKKSHEVQAMSEVVASLAQRCRVTQVVDVGSGKGYLCSFLSLRYGLRVFGVDSSLTNTHGAQERNRKLKKYSRAYQKHTVKGRPPRAAPPAEDITASKSAGGGVDKVAHADDKEHKDAECDETELRADTVTPRAEEEEVTSPPLASPAVADTPDAEAGDPFAGALSVDAVEPARPRVPPSRLSAEERERRRRENLERKARSRADSSDTGLYSPFTSYVTAETELREIIAELEEAVMVGLHTCGDLAPSMLRMFVAKRELVCVCSVGCCYHLLSEEYDPSRQEGPASSVCGFPMSRYLRDQSWFCGRNARMSACLALERVAVGQGIQMESLFYRAVLHVILRDHYGAFRSEKRVGNIYSKASSFVDYVQRALRRLELDEGKLSSSVIQGYHDAYRPRMCEMQAFNMLKVTLAPCIEGLLLLDRLCYLKEQEDVSFSALVQLFDPVQSPRCYGVVGVKTPGTAGEKTPGTAGETPGRAGETPGTAGETPGTAGEKTPGTAGLNTPGTAGETPGTAGLKTPGTAGETPGTAGETPGTAGLKTPGTAGETPGTAGETPGTAGLKTPGTAGETPGTAGLKTPGTAGLKTPGTAGEKTPGTAGETPGTAGLKTPGTAGEKTPGTAGETPGTAEETPGRAGETPGTAGETPGTAGETPGTAGETPGRAGAVDTPTSQ